MVAIGVVRIEGFDMSPRWSSAHGRCGEDKREDGRRSATKRQPVSCWIEEDRKDRN